VLAPPATWSEGYARLVRAPGLWLHESAPRLDDRVEGAAVVPGARHPEVAGRLLRALAVPDQSDGDGNFNHPEADSLLADLLGAALIEARDELREARRALDTAGRPSVPEAWMAQPPPWPPASIAQILAREDGAMPLLETLAAQVAPDGEVRSWLLRSWLAPPRLIDDGVLSELARAAGGRLAREPRFRAWLRSEWRAWARQRYRRVARLAHMREKKTAS
jgi:hypothetical protein